jgi:hypothetical protein
VQRTIGKHKPTSRYQTSDVLAYISQLSCAAVPQIPIRYDEIKSSGGAAGDPIKQLINTHWHFDHTGGNEWVHEVGASILAHENTRKHLSQATRVEGNWQYTFPVAPAGPIPSTVFPDEHTLHFNNTTLILKHYSPAHTDSDISVYFSRSRHFSYRRHFLEPRLPVYRLRDRRQHRRPHTSGRGKCCKSDRQDDRYSRTRSRGR